jgi:hypothetical protein
VYVVSLRGYSRAKRNPEGSERKIGAVVSCSRPLKPAAPGLLQQWLSFFPRFLNVSLVGRQPMTEAIDRHLIFEVLKKVQSDVALVKADVGDLKSMQLRMQRGFQPLRDPGPWNPRPKSHNEE